MMAPLIISVLLTLFFLLRVEVVYEAHTQVIRHMVYEYDDWFVRSRLMKQGGSYMGHVFLIHKWTVKQMFPSLWKHHHDKT